VLRARLVIVALVWSVAVAPAAQPDGWSIAAPPSLGGVAARIARLDHATIAHRVSAAGLPMPQRVHIVLVAGDDPVARQSPPWVVGNASGADTIVIFPDRVGSYPYDSLAAVVTHEIAHLALTARAGNRPLPRWFHEGVAVSVESGWGIDSQLRLLWAALRNPALDDVERLFASASQPAATTAYALSAAVVEDIRRRHGRAVPGAIAARVAAGTAFDEAFRAVTGESPAQAAVSAWRFSQGLRWIQAFTSGASLWGIILALATLAFVLRRRQRQGQRRKWEMEEGEN
jgi:hypothetical protein